MQNYLSAPDYTGADYASKGSSINDSMSALQAISVQYQTQGANISRGENHQVIVPLNQASFKNDSHHQNAHNMFQPLIKVGGNPISGQINGTTTREKVSSNFAIFSNSFDESGVLQLDNRPQRNCKSSTRMLNKTQQNHHHGSSQQFVQVTPSSQHPIPLLQNLAGNSQVPLTSSTLNRKQEVFNNYMKSKQNPQGQFTQQAAMIASQQKSGQNPNGLNSSSFDIKLAMQTNSQDLSNRSHLVHTSGLLGQQTTPYQVNQNNTLYGGGGSSSGGNSSKPITPHHPGSNNAQLLQSVILSASSGGKSGMNQQTPQQQSMDPYAYFKWKQQKYKSSRSIQGASNNNAGGSSGYGYIPGVMCPSNPGQMNELQRQNSNSSNMNNSQQIVIGNNPYPQFQHTHQRAKGNQTQKNNKSSCSSGHGSVLNSSSTGLTMGHNGGQVIKTLSEVNNPQYFISLRFSDRKCTELHGINAFKNLSELDISGNSLIDEIPELKQLQFLKKLNLSNNQIVNIYPLPSNLEILNLSYNKLKSLKSEVTLGLKNLTTLDVTHNGLENLEGMQNMKRLKRLLSKNNQIQELHPLNELEKLIEIDLENNPVDNYIELLKMLENKKDILVVNLKLSPIFLTISGYDQLCAEMESCLENQKNEHNNSKSNGLIDSFKRKLKHFQGGCLYRSKRAFQKLRDVQKHSKRSSSNFSNGSSSCGRGVHTGGRAGKQNQGSSSGNAPFSPMINNQVSTPNQLHPNTAQNNHQHHITQRFEEMEQLYDEILDFEEEQERRQLRIQRKKLKKPDDDIDSAEDDESMSMYEEEDDEDDHTHMSYDEDIDELQSYRNNHAGIPEGGVPLPTNDFLNESTADFSKEIRQANIELREQNEMVRISDHNNIPIGSNGGIPDHLQSFQSTQSLVIHHAQANSSNLESVAGSNMNTLKKNPISFKLDLSKCTNQQSEEDDDEDNYGGGAHGMTEDGLIDIPGLQFVKVSDDSFRQYSKSSNMNTNSSQQQLQSTRQQQQSNNAIGAAQISGNRQNNNVKVSTQNTSRGNATIQENPVAQQPIPRPQKTIIIPKLQLGILQQQHNIPMKQGALLSSGGNFKQNLQALQSSLRNGNNQKTECQNEQCRIILNEMRDAYESEKAGMISDIKMLRGVITEIKDIFKISARGDVMSLPGFIREFKEMSREQNEKGIREIETLNQKCLELGQWKNEQEKKNQLQIDVKEHIFEENEKTITNLREQLNKALLSQRQNSVKQGNPNAFTNNFFTDFEDLPQDSKDFPNLTADLKRTFSSKYQQTQPKTTCLLTSNPAYFYNSSSHNQLLSSTGREAEEEDPQVEVITRKMITRANPQQQSRKQTTNGTQKGQKRPQSVVTQNVNQKRGTQGIKINSMLKGGNGQVNEDLSGCGANEYCSNQELLLPLDLSNIHALIGENSGDPKSTPLSQTMNRKVGHYLQRLKERNSSLQERLNGSFRDGSGSHSALNLVSSPTPIGLVMQGGGATSMINLNLIQNKGVENNSSNPYILSPANHRYNESITSGKLAQYQSVKQEPAPHQIINVQNSQYQSNNSVLGHSLNLGNGLMRKISYKEVGGCNSNTRRYSQYNSSGGIAVVQHVKGPSVTHTSNNVIASSQREMADYSEQQQLNKETISSSSGSIVNNNNVAEGQTTQSAPMKQHSKTQRIHVNRIQYNQLMGAMMKDGLQAQVALQQQQVFSGRQVNERLNKRPRE